ncbi:V-type proton ATPase subunit S1 like protein [Argiope bruennichi]|uniref:V-type proton ATPase subunit S1 like protein n=2 Tax=Argiope bruennichi TaxID=94029 RepID=A0A8T0FWT9_ARGBR|nr:V-type proton ATPase subunit S1 like protein [Argiope bruennichi]
MHRNLFLLCIYIFIFVSSRISADQVPAALWNIKGDALHVVPASALGKDDRIFDNSLKEVVNSGAKILVFVLDKLSLEDFSAGEKPLSQNDTIQNLQQFLDQEKYMFLSSVKDPLSRIHEVHCGVQEIAVDGNIDENLLSISLAFDKSCVVILHITDAGVAGLRGKMFKPSFKKDYSDIVGIFTGIKSSWVGMKDDHYYSRNLLEFDTAELDADPNFLNFTGCLLVYAENATLGIDNKTIVLPFPYDYEGSECGNDTALLQMKFKTSDEKYSSVVVKFNFTNILGSYSTQVALEAGDVFTDLNAKDLEAPLDFSFSCGNYVLQNKNMTEAILVKLTFNRFQVQPFRVKDKFSESFDCITWFTVPIWMGVFISLILIVIVNVGVYALSSIHTMDRFDDPKGKTITVAAGVD